MKKAFLFVLVATVKTMLAQDPLYTKICQRIKAEQPELRTENKIMVVNVWDPSSQESRKKNVQLNNAYTTYEFAKLKGGSKGMIAVLICIVPDINQQEIVLGKDKVSKAIRIADSRAFGVTETGNYFFDSNGNIMSKNVAVDLFREINQLITR